jgi:hypothetical protein
MAPDALACELQKKRVECALWLKCARAKADLGVDCGVGAGI